MMGCFFFRFRIAATAGAEARGWVEKIRAAVKN